MTDTTAIKLIIVDDHAVIREGLKQIIGSTEDIVVVGEAENGFDAIKLSRQLEYDIMLLDISLPDKNGIEVLKQIKKESPQISILMFSIHREDQYAVRSHKSGASGYLNKQASADEILRAIRQLASGLKYISPELAQEMANNLNQEYEGELHKTLSDREFQTMTMIASGKNVSDIARELSLSVKTISEYRARILLKMKLRHNAELTHYAIKNQLVE
ncbi:response regulator transcription factor [Undibacterium sp. RTI2.1]|uniref:response regulator transcription factor n=1 Tax=unclassified Undibacterium TaxID=2630295 RepID=UPI002AB3432B|nr:MULTISPECIES: response regulator transcription factor [unclassified Undibacterium]MDY7537143.1 response regulator transcription factor [Undibacterium sp. 5I1]MEB0029818.1 response regulator transcription factor [Undibacterium sp. RTI2.1]MEB0115103.1 response regulator transcription factor [Undibacterium sp. RTI2.2]MEB0229321.1 response regulator transcription factor [Undibacterium sp. 10I3]MEB0256131.1 response regulator transcription factor [Undibacterium sp. 5I1]